MTRPLLLDLFCGGGGAAMGYAWAGFDVVGVDIDPQPRYPFEFVQGDALEVLDAIGSGFDAIHASPPCQKWSVGRNAAAGKHGGREHPDLITPLRPMLRAMGVPYVIENVPRAPLIDPLTLCGSMFGLGTDDRWLRRHRAFESDLLIFGPGPCAHPRDQRAISVFGAHGGGGYLRDGSGLPRGSTADWKVAMGIDWMRTGEINEAIPPAYTEWIGTQLIAAIR